MYVATTFREDSDMQIFPDFVNKQSFIKVERVLVINDL